MENKEEIIRRLENSYRATRLGISTLVYRTTDDGGEYVDVMVHHLNRPWLTVNITADSGAALIYDVAKAVIHNL